MSELVHTLKADECVVAPITEGGAVIGLVAVVDGLLEAATHTWGSWQVLLPLLSGLALLALSVPTLGATLPLAAARMQQTSPKVKKFPK